MSNDDTLTAVSAAFPIVGIGVSAGGLTALDQMPVEPDHVYVIPPGLAITFADISTSKRLEVELRQAQDRLQALTGSQERRGHGLS